MRYRMPLNEKGMSLILVLVIFALIGISAITILTMGEQKRRVSQQMNLTITAQQVKQKLMGLVLAPQSWQAIQTYNAPAFAMFPDPAVTTTTVSPPTSFPTLDLYEPNSTAPYYKTSDHNAGFDLRGNPCTSFKDTSDGNDKCPLRYIVTLIGRNKINGNWVDKLHFALKFRPSPSSDLILNDGSTDTTNLGLSFDLTRNVDTQSVETACTSVNGTYDVTTNTCSTKLTRTVASCSSSQTYSGPGLTDAGTNCNNVTVPTANCNDPLVVKGFDDSGNPICGAAL